MNNLKVKMSVPPVSNTVMSTASVSTDTLATVLTTATVIAADVMDEGARNASAKQWVRGWGGL